MPNHSPSTSVQVEELQNLYADLIETSQDLIWQCDTEGRFNYLNPAWETTFGYRCDEMLGRRFSDFQSLNSTERDWIVFSRLLEGETLRGYETTFQSQSGKPIHLVFNAKTIVDKKGEVRGARGTAYDITERKYMEMNIAASEARFRAMIDNAPFGAHLYELHSDNRLVFIGANTTADTILKVNNIQLIGKTIEEAFPNLVATDIPEAYRTVARSGNPFFADQVLFASDNQGVSGAFELSAFQTGYNKMAVLFRDITDKKRAEEALRESEEKFRTLFNTMVQGVVYENADGTIIDVNPAAERILGLSSDQMKGLTSMDPRWKTIHEDGTDFPGDQHPLPVVLKTGKTVVDVVQGVYHPEKKCHIWIKVNAVPLFRPGSTTPYQAYATFEDITEHRRTEEVLQRAQKLESLGMLAGGIAHDFNNLLGGMFGYVDIAMVNIDDGRLQEASDSLVKATAVFERTKVLTRHLLTFAKGGIPVRAMTDIASLIRSNVPFALSGSNVTTDFDIAKDLWQCDCDENQIGQVIENIVINAQQAMPLGGTIHVAAHNVCGTRYSSCDATDGDHFIKISIQDQGIGIPIEHLPKIFDPFFSTKAIGYGLGLAAVYSIIRRHGGWIDVASEQGKGTTFHVFLPAVSPVVAPRDTTKTQDDHHPKGRVLVMDDEAIIRETISDMLGRMGYEVVVAADGNEALSLFIEAQQSEKKFQVTILDLNISDGMDGKETASKIREIDRDTIIVCTSGYADEPLMEDLSTYGFTATILKPFRKRELGELLENLIGKSASID